MDTLFGKLLKELSRIGILDKINIIIVSDHGMEQLKSDSNIGLADYIDLKLIDRQKSVYGVISNIYPASMDQVNKK